MRSPILLAVLVLVGLLSGCASRQRPQPQSGTSQAFDPITPSPVETRIIESATQSNLVYLRIAGGIYSAYPWTNGITCVDVIHRLAGASWDHFFLNQRGFRLVRADGTFQICNLKKILRGEGEWPPLNAGDTIFLRGGLEWLPRNPQNAAVAAPPAR
jgi:hypothetical protein